MRKRKAGPEEDRLRDKVEAEGQAMERWWLRLSRAWNAHWRYRQRLNRAIKRLEKYRQAQAVGPNGAAEGHT